LGEIFHKNKKSLLHLPLKKGETTLNPPLSPFATSPLALPERRGCKRRFKEEMEGGYKRGK